MVGAFWLLYQFENQKDCLPVELFSQVTVKEQIQLPHITYRFSLCSEATSKALNITALKYYSTLRSELTKFENLVLVSGDTIDKIFLQIVQRPIYKVTIEPQKVVLGEKIFSSKGLLFKALSVSWLLQKNPSLQNNLIAREVLSDFLVAVGEGGLVLQSPLTGKRAEFSGWPQDKEAINQDPCNDVWLPMNQIDLCAILLSSSANQELDLVKRNVKKQMSDYSSRAFLGYKLWQSYKQIGLTQRVRALRKLLSWVESENFLQLNIPVNPKEWPEVAAKQSFRAFGDLLPQKQQESLN